MSSPRSMFSGTIQIGLVNVPITLGKSWSDERETSLKQVCICHKQPIDRSERCSVDHTSPVSKLYAVQVEEGVWRPIDENEMAQIESDTTSKILDVIDVQPVSKLPLLYATGCYYCRHDKKAKMEPTAMATLVASLTKGNLGLVCKWGNASREKLCVITAEAGILILRVIPFLENVRVASTAEREHFRAKPDPKNVTKMTELLDAIQNPNGFQYAEHHDEGLRLRTEAVERIIAGKKSEPRPEPKMPEQTDIFAMIDAAIAEVRS